MKHKKNVKGQSGANFSVKKRGRPPKNNAEAINEIISKNVRNVEVEKPKRAFRVREVNFNITSPKSVKKGKMNIDTEQMLKDLVELGRIKPEDKKIKENKFKKRKEEFLDLPKSPLVKLIEKRNSSIFKISAIFFGIVIIFMFSVLYILSSKTVININLKKISNDVDLQKNFELYNDRDSITSSDVVAVSANLKTTLQDEYFVEMKDVASDIVEGRIKIVNNSNERKVFVKTTRFISDVTGSLYRLKEDTVIPANGDIEVTVYADNKDINGENVGVRFTVPGLKTDEAKKLIYGESVESFFKGSTKKQIIDSGDISKANDILDVKLKQKAVEELRAKIEDSGDFEMITSSIEFLIYNKKNDGVIGKEVSTIRTSGAIDISAIFVNKNKILNLVKGDILSQNTNGYAINIDKDNMVLDVLRADSLTRDLVLNIKTKAYSSYDVAKLLDKKEIAGMNVNSFYQYVSDRGFAQSVNVVNYPFWNQKITTVLDNIIIRVK